MSKRTTSGNAGLSLRTKDATKGGGTEGALATIAEIGFVDEFTYGGRQKDKPQAALRVEFHIEGFDKPWEQHYTVGPSERYEVVADGDGIRSLGKSTGLNEKSSAFRFFSALETAAEEGGIDLDEITPELDGGGTSVRPLEGARVRLTNVKFETVGGDIKEVIVIGAFEGEAAPAKGTKKTAGKAPAAGSIETQTETAIVALLKTNSPIKKSALGDAIYQANRKDPNVKALMQQSMKDRWVFAAERPWDFDNKKGVLKLREDEDAEDTDNDDED